MPIEGRGLHSNGLSRTLSVLRDDEIMGTKLERIAEISAETKKPVFTSIYHLINAELLKQCHKELDGKKAVGVDKVTRKNTGKNLDKKYRRLSTEVKEQIF